MAIRVFEGFDDGLYAHRAYSSNGAVSGTYGKDGNGMRVGDNTGTYHILSCDGWGQTNTIGFNCYVTNWLSGQVMVSNVGNSAPGSFSSYGGTAIMVDSGNNRIGVWDKSGTVYGSINSFYANTWYYVEWTWTVNNAPNGSWELKVDGLTYVSATGRDTQYNYDPVYCRFGGYNGNDIDQMYIDNIYQTDDSGTDSTGFLGLGEVEVLLPNGNGNSSNLVGSDGNSTDNYLLVDNNASIPPATAEYVESDTQGDKDTYAMDDLSGTNDVLGVTTSFYHQKDASGAKLVRPVIRSNGTDYTGTSVALSNGTWTLGEEAWGVDPDTSAQWAYTAVNAMEVGPEVRDS